MTKLSYAALATLSVLPLPAAALDYLSLAEAAVMYDAPSQKAAPQFVIALHTPVAVVVALESWYKVRDAAGGIAWVEKRQLSPKRTLQVTVPRVQVRSQPDANAAPVFEAEKDVVLELVEVAEAGWVKIRHRDGQSGFVRANQVWGL
ncbi:MAG: SH3 domain-containing protein [Proteobacteria bacterium]|nr:SH3 domain-containing protein [Pseudomonadota bacterium]